MRRRLVIVLLLLVGGAIVNVAVAWGCAPYAETLRAHWRELESSESQWWLESRLPYDSMKVTGGLKDWGFGSRSVWVGGVIPAPEKWIDTPALAVGLQVVETGLPWVSLSYERRSLTVQGNEMPPKLRGAWSTSIQNPWMPAGSTIVLPYCAIWPGFAINTVFYAVMLWLLFAAPFALRRRRRIRRGLCPACAYPMGESHVCTECGKAVKEST